MPNLIKQRMNGAFYLAHKTENRPHIQVKIADQYFQALADTGAASFYMKNAISQYITRRNIRSWPHLYLMHVEPMGI